MRCCPIISIIVPVYNVESYLRRCVDSILAQTYTDFELILVDDGSPDGCPVICDEYATKDDRITVIHKQNGGLSDARNAGLDIARGKYIGFVDSDDSISPYMYERLIDLLEKNDADIAATGFLNIDQDGNVVAEYPKLECEKVYCRKDYIDCFYPQIKWHIMTCACNKLYRRRLFDNLRYPVGRVYEDSFVQLPLFDSCNRIAVSTEHDYYYYSTRAGSIMNSSYSKKMFQLIELSMSQYSFFVDKAIKTQQDYALATYVTNYMINFFAVYMTRKDFRYDFSPYRKQFRSYIGKILSNPQICRMKKINVLLMYINKKAAYRLAKKFFPESLPDFLRV